MPEAIASAVAGLLWTAVSPLVAFGYLVVWTLLAFVGLLTAHRSPSWRIAALPDLAASLEGRCR